MVRGPVRIIIKLSNRIIINLFCIWSPLTILNGHSIYMSCKNGRIYGNKNEKLDDTWDSSYNLPGAMPDERRFEYASISDVR